MSMLLSSDAPHTSAANWKAISRCWPLVVPGLPPTGAAGVGSLNPSLGPSALTTVMCALAAAGAGSANAMAATSASGRRRRMVVGMALLLPIRLGLLGQERHGVLHRADALHVDCPVLVRSADQNVIESFQPNQFCSARGGSHTLSSRRHRGEGGDQLTRFLLRQLAELAGALVDSELSSRQGDRRIFAAVGLLRGHADVVGQHRHGAGEPDPEHGKPHTSRGHQISPLWLERFVDYVSLTRTAVALRGAAIGTARLRLHLCADAHRGSRGRRRTIAQPSREGAIFRLRTRRLDRPPSPVRASRFTLDHPNVTGRSAEAFALHGAASDRGV